MLFLLKLLLVRSVKIMFISLLFMWEMYKVSEYVYVFNAYNQYTFKVIGNLKAKSELFTHTVIQHTVAI